MPFRKTQFSIGGFQFNLKSIGVLIGIGFFAMSCSVTKQIAIDTLEPAPVDLSREISRIGIINQVLTNYKTEASSDLEAWVIHEDRQLAAATKDAALLGLFDQLLQDSRFDTIIILKENDESFKNLVSESEIPWQDMKNLCLKNNIDALFALASHETETQVKLRKTKIELKDLVRDVVRVKGHEITLETLIENGWRIYDPFNQEILDEIIVNNQLISSGKGEDPIRAFQAIENRKDSALVLSKRAGNNFGLRLQPHVRTIQRAYFVKGTDNFQKARLLAEVEDWKAAANLWEIDMKHENAKIRSRALYNMAVINELHGDIQTAVEWAAKSYKEYELKMTREYIDALNSRISDQILAEEQYFR